MYKKNCTTKRSGLNSKYKFPSGLIFLDMSRKYNSREKKKDQKLLKKKKIGFNRTTRIVLEKEFSVLGFAWLSTLP